MLGGVFEQNVEPILLDRIHHHEGMVGSNQDFELTKLVLGWRHPPQHDFRIGGGWGGCQLRVRAFDTLRGEFTLGPMAALGDKVLDKRIVERNMAKGLVSKEDYEQHIAALPDKEGAYERVGVETPESPDEDPME